MKTPLAALSETLTPAPLDKTLAASRHPVIAPSTLHFGPPQPGMIDATIASMADWLIPSLLPPLVGSLEANGFESPTLTLIGSTVALSVAIPCPSVVRPSPVIGLMCCHIRRSDPSDCLRPWAITC